MFLAGNSLLSKVVAEKRVSSTSSFTALNAFSPLSFFESGSLSSYLSFYLSTYLFLSV